VKVYLFRARVKIKKQVNEQFILASWITMKQISRITSLNLFPR
jgi:hypothetical protein